MGRLCVRYLIVEREQTPREVLLTARGPDLIAPAMIHGKSYVGPMTSDGVHPTVARCSS